jgi:hypothetical protein
MPLAHWRETIDMRLTGTMLVTRTILPFMIARRLVIGLMKAVERFDPAKGGKLSTYSAWWIKQSIKRALANKSKTIRLPVHLVDKVSKMRRVSLQISEELGREPTDDELAEEIGISSGKVSQLKTVSIRPASLDAPISDDDSSRIFSQSPASTGNHALIPGPEPNTVKAIKMNAGKNPRSEGLPLYVSPAWPTRR